MLVLLLAERQTKKKEVIRLRITLDFESDSNIVLPVNYQSYLQGFIYSNIADDEVRNNLHNEGMRYKGSPFKHFTFSRLIGRFKYNNADKTLSFGKQVSFVLSTKLEDVEREILKSCFMQENLRLARNNLKLKELKIDDLALETNNDLITWDISMLSPITIFQTSLLEKERKYRNFFSPNEYDAQLIISHRLEQKYISYYGDTNGLDFNILLKPTGVLQKTVVKVKNNEVYEAYSGNFTLTGQEKVLKFAYDIGIGKKNSLGFGMFEKK